MRDETIWRLQQLEPGVRLRIRLHADSPFRGILGPSDAPTTMVRAALGPSEARAAEPPVTTAPPTKTRPVAKPGARATRAATKRTPAVRTHRVRRGETSADGAAHGTSARA
jgi:hypothetical protein